MCVVIANDGTEVDDDETLAAVSEPLMLLTGGECWLPEIVGASVIATTHDSATATTSHDVVVDGTCQLTEPTPSTSAAQAQVYAIFANKVALCRCYCVVFGLSLKGNSKFM